MKKVTSLGTSYYFYDPAGRLLQELAPAIGSGQDYIYVDGAPLARNDWTSTETSVGDVLRAYKSGANVHLDWSSYAPTGDSYVVRRKQVVDTDDKTFNGALAITTLDYPTETYDDPVVGNGNRYDYEILKQTKSDVLSYYHTDQLGTPIALTSSSGSPVWKVELRPFGDLYGYAFSDKTNNLRFPGQYFDSETGLHQNWFRDYSSKTGRYGQADPIELAGAVNPYAYVRSNPTDRIDPNGLLDIFIGGFIDRTSTIVTSYQAAYSHIYSDRASLYVTWRESGKAIAAARLARAKNRCEPINLVGHSYGGSAAASVSRRLRAIGIDVNLLITIDPVSRARSRGPGAAGNWVDVNAAPSSSNGLAGDAWAKLGGKWGNWPDGRADSYYTAPYHHNEFGDLFEFAPAGGKSALQILLDSDSACSCE